MGIFRSYDIRGEYGSEIDVEKASKIGYAFGLWLKAHEQTRGWVAVAGDARISTEALRNSVKSGLLASGLNVYDLGMVPTPTFYFVVAHLGLDGGAMITASHLPAKFNGIKLVKRGAESLSYESGIGDIENVVAGNLSFSPELGGREASLQGVEDFYWAYIKEVAGFEPGGGLKVAVDAGNGVCGYFARRLASEGYQVLPLYTEPDGRFPHHVPDPLVDKNVADLAQLVKSSGADVGIAFDGDGDRLGVVDEAGRHVTSDQLVALLAAEELRSNPGGLVVHDVLTSALVDEVVKKAGGRVLVTRTGHSYINLAIKTNGAIMGGESSGHIYFASGYYGFDDASLAALKTLVLLRRAKEEGKTLADLVNSLPVYYSTPEFRVPCPEEKKQPIINKLIDRLTKEGYKVNTMDGVRVDEDYGWGIVRPSNTEAAMVMRFEAKDQASLKKIEELFAPTIREELGVSL